MKKKKILVSDILNIMDDTDKVCVMLYAYGVQGSDESPLHQCTGHKDQM